MIDINFPMRQKTSTAQFVFVELSARIEIFHKSSRPLPNRFGTRIEHGEKWNLSDARLSWLDLTAADRDKVRRVLDLFSEQGTVDELGLGSLRDTISNALFPGTSVLHTRLRYVLFIPWVYQELESWGVGYDVERHAREMEIQLISASTPANHCPGWSAKLIGPCSFTGVFSCRANEVRGTHPRQAPSRARNPELTVIWESCPINPVVAKNWAISPSRCLA